jgi:hypothetical protein
LWGCTEDGIEEVDRRGVEFFLPRLKEKLKVFGMVFRPREKNTEALLQLDITPRHRQELILKLTADDYYAGPQAETHDPERPEYYEFGIIVKKEQVYIKLSPGLPGKSVDCMSFHIAEWPMKLPLKPGKK